MEWVGNANPAAVICSSAYMNNILKMKMEQPNVIGGKCYHTSHELKVFDLNI